MKLLPTKESFLQQVEQHQLKVIRDDGVNRHLHFKRPETFNQYFDLVTWAGHLCIAGDMGTYVFSRIPDMFEFFRTPDELRINPSYWAEKVQAMDRNAKIENYDADKFRRQVTNYLNDHEASQELRDAVKREVMGAADGGEFFAMKALLEFRHDDFRFDYFYELNITEYSYQFLWCCYAIVWGIEQYDKHKADIAQ